MLSMSLSLIAVFIPIPRDGDHWRLFRELR